MTRRFRWIGLDEKTETVTLKRFKGEFAPHLKASPEWLAQNAQHLKRGLVLDTETTGLDHDSSSVIEIGLRPFSYDARDGRIANVFEGYSALQDPGEPLDPRITQITGLTDDMLKGQSIDWARVEDEVRLASLIVAHNASFDRPFIDAKVPLSASRVWACSLTQVDWDAKQFPTRKLEILQIYHGFYTDSHRALEDSDALLHLLSTPDATTHQSYFAELLATARKPTHIVRALGAPFEAKNLLRARRYQWSPERKCWHRTLTGDELESERAWLEQFVYTGQKSSADFVEIPFQDRFKRMR